ncbi:hypothetical protein BDV19DRAFT_364088 [Aspergillus venezuelensis]
MNQIGKSRMKPRARTELGPGCGSGSKVRSWNWDSMESSWRCRVSIYCRNLVRLGWPGCSRELCAYLLVDVPDKLYCGLAYTGYLLPSALYGPRLMLETRT